ncbi:MAG: biopolymer transporter ExbD [Oxalobacter sp.]|nr:MAG: biopolymer transporter ExbD [Oxalobacter sp.]
MNFRKGKVRDDPEINLIPFIDVLLVILIFLMVTTTYNRYSELQIILPTAEAIKVPDRPLEINIAVSASGDYAINNNRVSYHDPAALAEDLRRFIPSGAKDAVLVISADGDAPHQRVINVMEAARLARLDKLTFATQTGQAQSNK